MALSTIKKEFADVYVAFGNGNEALGKREDIDELAIIAQSSGDRSLLQFFDKLPSLDELKKAKTDSQLPKKAAATAAAEPAKASEPAK